MLAVVLIAAFESACAYFDNYLYPPPFDGLQFKLKNDLAQSGKSSFDVVIFGDSYVLLGIMPEVIEKGTGLSAFNFSTYADFSAFTSYLLLKNYLSSRAGRPTLIIAGFLPSTVTTTKEYLVENKQHVLYHYSRGNILLFAKEFGAAQAVKFLVPSLKHQDFWKLRVWFSGRTMVDGFIKQFYQRKGYADDRAGWVYTGARARDERPDELSASLFFQKYFLAFLRLARQNGVKVLYVVPALPPDIASQNVQSGRTGQYLSFLRSVQESFGFKILDPQAILDKNDYFADEAHLNGQGARRMSEYLASVIGDEVHPAKQP